MRNLFSNVLIPVVNTECKGCTGCPGLRKCYFCGDKICCKKASRYLLNNTSVYVCQKGECENKAKTTFFA